MTQVDSNTNSHKGKHLTFDERSQITVLKKEGYSNRAIARVLKRSHQAINDEIKRGMVTQLRIQKQNGKTYKYYEEIYDRKVGQDTYDHNRLNSGRRPKWAEFGLPSMKVVNTVLRSHTGLVRLYFDAVYQERKHGRNDVDKETGEIK